MFHAIGICVRPRSDTEAALSQIAGWFEEYNKNHPHSELRVRSPLEHIYSHQLDELAGEWGATPVVRQNAGNSHGACGHAYCTP